MTRGVRAAALAALVSLVSSLGNAGVADDHYGPRITYIEPGVGAWLNRRQLVKLSYAVQRTEGQRGRRMNVLGIQLVTTLNNLQWATP